MRRGAASGAVTVRTPACRRGSSRADPHHWGAAPLEVKTPMPLQRVAVGGMRRCLCSVPQGLGPEMAGTRLGPGSRKKIRDPGTSITAEKFKVFRTGLESKGATEYSLKNAVENSHQNLMTQPIVQLDLPLAISSTAFLERVVQKSCGAADPLALEGRLMGLIREEEKTVICGMPGMALYFNATLHGVPSSPKRQNDEN